MYEETLEKYNLGFDDLNEQVQFGIENIDGVIKGINMLQKNGKLISDKTIGKIKEMDKWVCDAITDVAENNNTNITDLPHLEDDVLEEAWQYAEENDKTDDEEVEEAKDLKVEVDGDLIDQELMLAYKNGKNTLSLGEIRTISKSAYKIIFDNYDDSGDNGIETSQFALIETDDEVFTLTKK